MLVSTGFLKVFRDVFVLPSGKRIVREVVDRPVAVAAICHNASNSKFYVCLQFRAPVNKSTYEIPAGLVDPGESPEQAMVREIREEIGREVISLKFLKGFYPSLGYSNEKILLYDAVVSEKFIGQDLDSDEELSVYEFSREEFQQKLIDLPDVVDSKSYIAWMKWKEQNEW